MFARDSGGWILTERTTLGAYLPAGMGIAILGLILGPEWRTNVGIFGVAGAGAVYVGFGSFYAVVLYWLTARTQLTAIRCTSAGIEVRRRLGSVELVPRDLMTLRPKGTDGFGTLIRKADPKGVVGRGPFYVWTLSPNQFAAATATFPVTERGFPPSPPPLP